MENRTTYPALINTYFTVFPHIAGSRGGAGGECRNIGFIRDFLRIRRKNGENEAAKLKTAVKMRVINRLFHTFHIPYGCYYWLLGY